MSDSTIVKVPIYQYRTLYDGIASEWVECSPAAYEQVRIYDWYERRKLLDGVEQP